MPLEEINQAGGFQGRPVEIIVRETGPPIGKDSTGEVK